MKVRFVRCLVAIGVLLALPVMAHAQEAVFTGTVTDSTGAVLPGVTVTAVHEATGNRFVAVTDERGVYRIPARVGGVSADGGIAGVHHGHAHRPAAAGRTDGCGRSADGAVHRAGDGDRDGRSAAAQRRDVEPWRQHRPASRCRICRSQGRNWMALAMLAPGSRMTNPTRHDAAARSQQGEQREFQFSLDGQNVAGRARVRWPAALLAGLDRRVPVHLQPVRRDAGTLIRRPGQGDHPLGHEHAVGLGARQLPG